MIKEKQRQNGPADKYELTPWRTEEEFQIVAKNVSSNDISGLEKALDQLHVWKLRVGAKMKDVYELTLAAVSGIVAMSRSTGSHMTDKLHSTSLAVVRFVSLITEGNLKDKTERPSVLELAQKFDIPEWLVDMRHSIVHGALPSYHLLHQALHFIKDYLVDKFWSLKTNSEAEDIIEQLSQLYAARMSDVKEERKALVAVFANGRHPHYYRGIQFIRKTMIEALVLESADSGKKTSIRRLIAVRFQPTLHALNSMNLIQPLLLSFVNETDDLERHCEVEAWILHVLGGFSKTCCQSEEEKLELLQSVLLNPAIAHLSSRLSTSLDFHIDCSKVIRLHDIYSSRHETTTPTHGRLFTVNDIRGITSVAKDNQESVTSKWHLAADQCWSGIPLGAVISSQTARSQDECHDTSFSDLVPEDKSEDADVLDAVDFSAERQSCGWSQEEMKRIEQSMAIL